MTSLLRLCSTLLVFNLGLGMATEHQMVLPNISPESSRSSVLAEVHETLNLLKASQNISLEDQPDVVLLLGNTGTGKTTLTQFIAGDETKLVATRRHGVFAINDGNNRIGNSTTTSKTIFPELVVDPRTGTAFVDCPGFSDTRSPAYDIAENYFIKHVFDSVQRVKMLFTITSSSLEYGNDRVGFPSLLSHACTLIENIDKFANSIMVVVTKVRNDYIEDKEVIDNIAGFMIDVRNTFAESYNLKDVDDEKRSFYSCAIKLIDIVTQKVCDSYTRIGIFRRPVEEGLLSNSPLLVKGRQNIETILANHTVYTTKCESDFNYTISDHSKHYITNKLNRYLNMEITASLASLTNNIEIKLVDDCVRSDNMYKLQLQLDAVENSLGRLTADNTLSEPKEFIDKVEQSLKIIGVDGKEILSNVKRQIGYLVVFQSFLKNNGEYFRTAHGLQKFLQAKELSRNLNNWYILLLDLYKKHSNYPDDNLENHFNESDLLDLGKDEHVFNLDKSNVHTFLEYLTKNSEANSFSIVDDDRVHSVALKDLNNVMNVAYAKYLGSCEVFLDTALDQLSEEIGTTYLKICNQSVDTKELQQMLRSTFESLQSLTQTEFISAEAFKIEALKSLQQIGVSNHSPLVHIDNLIKHNRFYEQFTNDTRANSRPEVWSKKLEPTAEYIRILDSWYVSILEVHAELSSKTLDMNTGQDNETYWAINPAQRVTESNMHVFLKNINVSTLSQYGRLLSDAKTVEVVLRDLNYVAHRASTLAASCEESIILDLKDINKAVQIKFEVQCKESNDMHSLLKTLRFGNIAITQLLTENKLTSESEFLRKLSNTIEDMSVPINRTAFSRISKRIIQLQYLKRFLIGETKNFNSSKWASIFLPGKDYIFGLTNWYTLLLDLHSKLSAYSFQKDTSKYQDINNWGVESKTLGLFINQNNVDTFLKKVQYLGLEGFKLINAINVEHVVFTDLNRILDLTLKTPPKKDDTGDTLTIEGQYVVISNIPELNQLTKYKSVNIFALNTVFIDANIERTGHDFEMTIIAPTWYVHENRSISLNGVAGQTIPKAEGFKSMDRPTKAAGGKNGVPGNPGSAGGSFFGVGHEFLGDHLEVSSSGGAGSPGQDGSDAQDGFREETIKKEKVNGAQVGTEGGDGGDGGVGGYGGPAGEISVIQLGNKSGVTWTLREGSTGAGGKGGAGGSGGYIAPIYEQYLICGAGAGGGGCGRMYRVKEGGEELVGGKRGIDGLNNVGSQKLHRFRDLPKSYLLNSFKSYSRSNLNNVASFSPLSTFLETLEKNTNL